MHLNSSICWVEYNPLCMLERATTVNMGINKRQKQELLNLTGEKVEFDCPMSDYTTLRVGGLVDAIYKAENVEELSRVIAYLGEEHIPYLPVGRGSNLLVKDEGLEGAVILLCGSLAGIEEKRENHVTLLAGAGLSISDLLNYCRSSGVGGVEFLAGIPGTVGGAVAMNAGAFGWEIGDTVQEVQMVTPCGKVMVRDQAQLSFSYRELRMEEGSLIIRVRFRVNQEAGEVVSGRIAKYLKRRKESQPLDYPSAGSVFKNPPDEYAGKLIEEAGLKGRRIGGAMISDKHANFIVNAGGAKAGDILALMELAQDKVRKKLGIELLPEIRVVGKLDC
jgi:UDP-N-acetylmuramate dehydrogenase